MATSVYFNNFSAATINEQRLMEDVIVESIKIMGHDVKYMPREAYDSTDDIIGESPQAKFSRAYTVEMYLANVEGYEGDGDFFSKFGLEIRDTSNFVISRRTFERYIPSAIATRPREGDLLFVPVLGKIFEIKFVEEELMFFALGKRSPYIYELRCEVFRYSQEDFSTGDSEIDDIENNIAYTIKLNLGNGSGNYNIGELVYQGANANTGATVTAQVKDWDISTKILEVINIKGIFAGATQVKGNTSNATYTVTTFDDLSDFIYNDDSDNRAIQTEANNFIDLTEINPFGVP
jgi:hypothetical protein